MVRIAWSEEGLAMFRRELCFLCVATILVDLTVGWLMCLWLGTIWDIILGLILGSVAVNTNFMLIAKDIARVQSTCNPKAFRGYPLRCIIACGCIALGLCADFLQPVAVILPFLYPQFLMLCMPIFLRESRSKTNQIKGGKLI